MNWSEYVSILNNNFNFKPSYWSKEIQELDLKIEVIDNAICLPSFLDVKCRLMPINIFNEKCEKIVSSHHFRGKNHDFFKDETNNNINHDEGIYEHIAGDTIFLGWLIPHYGHFLMESISRLWVLGELKSKNYKFLFNYYNDGDSFLDKKKWAVELLLSFGVKSEQIIFANKNYQFDRLYIPSQSMILHSNVNSKAQAFIWNKIKNHLIDKNKMSSVKKVYLSRSKLIRDKRKLINELDVENTFKKFGFDVIYPETLSLSEQVTILSTVDFVAGPSGSALHNAAFLKKDAVVVSLTTTDFCLLNEVLCCYGAETRYQLFFGQSEQGNKWSINIDSLCSALSSHPEI